MLITPKSFGARGDGIFDDGPAINLMFKAVMDFTEKVLIDLTGNWFIGETIQFTAPTQSTIIAGNFNVFDDVNLDVALNINLKSFCHVQGILRVSGKKSSLFRNRNLTNGIYLHLANGCIFDGFHVQYVKGFGIINALMPGSNIIGATLGNIVGLNCGYPSIPGIQSYLKLSSMTTNIERIGVANSIYQTAKISLSESLPIKTGDYLLIGGQPKDGGHICEVIDIFNDEIFIYPWPGKNEGPVELSVVPIIGGVIKLSGNNTTQVSINKLIGQYCGQGAQINSLYGCKIDSIMVEVAGSAITIGKYNTAIKGVFIQGLHSELCSSDIIIGSLSLDNSTLMASIKAIIPDVNGYHIKPTLNNGEPSIYSWPLIEIR